MLSCRRTIYENIIKQPGKVVFSFYLYMLVVIILEALKSLFLINSFNTICCSSIKLLQQINFYLPQ